MGVDRCICHDITFTRLQELAARHGHDLDALARVTGCSTNCGMCKPYILRMLETGQTLFPVFSEPACREIIARWEATRAAKRVNDANDADTGR
jgi:bacterioferritin-associated ferredoxin